MIEGCEELKRRLAVGDPPFRLERIEQLEHLLDCESCREQWLAAALIPEAVIEGPDCIGRARIPELVEQSDGVSREERLEHVASCNACTAALARWLRDLDRIDGARLEQVPAGLERQALGAPGLAATERRERPPATLRWTVRLAAAAGVVLAAFGLGLLFVDRVPRVGDGSGTFRGTAGSSVPVALSPQGDVAAAELTFDWQGGRQADGRPYPAYRLVVVDLETGTTRLDARTESITFTPTAEQLEGLPPGVVYHWVVEPDGGMPSEPVSFRIAP